MKKLFTLFMVALLLGAAALFPSATVSRPVGLNPGYWKASGHSIRVLNRSGQPAPKETSLLEPGDRIQISLLPEMFVDSRGLPLKALTLAQLKAGRIEPRIILLQGQNRLKSSGLARGPEGVPCIELAFADPLLSVSAEPFSVTVQLQIAGEAQAAAQLNLTGEIANPQVEITESNTLVDLSSGLVGIASQDVRDIEIQLGEGISLLTDLREGQQVYAIARPQELAPELLERYPSLEGAYSVDTINLEQVNALLFTLPQRFYVYSRAGSYCGTTDNPVALEGFYYLSSTRLNALSLPE
ncbi:hypothetical protein U6B65_07790 [Oscillospiraceae bacterium MB08-C2-2]|nr:hypothetical protein U6B65_07790 [Oscillospiraceae bacterium MB08-C2-2]